MQASDARLNDRLRRLRGAAALLGIAVTLMALAVFAGGIDQLLVADLGTREVGAPAGCDPTQRWACSSCRPPSW